MNPARSPILPRRYLFGATLAAPLLARPAQARSLRPLRVGYIVNGPERTIFEEKFEQGMRENGYVVGRNLAIDDRHHLRHGGSRRSSTSTTLPRSRSTRRRGRGPLWASSSSSAALPCRRGSTTPSQR